MIDLLELYFYEDCPYEDESVELLGISGKGTLRIVSREAGVCALQMNWPNITKKKELRS